MTEERIVAYLLEDLSEEEMERFEDECFASEEWPAQVALVEEDLINDYLRDELAPEQRRSFEQKYLTTAARVERVRMAAALLRHLDAYQPGAEATAGTPDVKRTGLERLRDWFRRDPWIPRAATALAVVVLAVGAWWLVRQPAGYAPARNFATLTLTVSHGDRAAGAQAGTVKLTPDVGALKLALTLPEPSAAEARYRVQLEDDNGTVRLSENAAREGQSVHVTIPAAQLARGRYALKLFAVGAGGTERRVPGSYLFNVE